MKSPTLKKRYEIFDAHFKCLEFDRISEDTNHSYIRYSKHPHYTITVNMGLSKTCRIYGNTYYYMVRLNSTQFGKSEVIWKLDKTAEIRDENDLRDFALHCYEMIKMTLSEFLNTKKYTITITYQTNDSDASPKIEFNPPDWPQTTDDINRLITELNFIKWKSETKSEGKTDEQTLRNIYNAIDDEDKKAGTI